MAQGEWYYCLDHGTVEPYEGCRSATRLGPYPTPAEAAQALSRVAQRNEEWENDPRFNDDLDQDADDREEPGPFAG
ncbi:MAG: hypothetical protein CVT65_04310 [Actinobacteria bacterium HGW-Actinobacteria-5]|jgi:hypothetical protein|nr:MAG: hypothetical protein CVT65_04310 [Actinobacteria bacterium HGW-Actinobacteria-5]